MNAIEKIKNVFDTYAQDTFLINSTDGQKFSYSDIYRDAHILANSLLKLGIRSGDRLGIILPNSIEHATLLFACMFYGITTVPINQVSTVSEISTILSEAKTSYIICDDNSFKKISSLPTGKNNTFLFSSILKNQNQHIDLDKISPFEYISEDTTLTIIFTSGTTGTPKGVIHRIKDLINNAALFCSEVGINSSNRFYNLLSMSYLGGYYNLLLLPFVAGASVVIAEAFSPHSAMDFWPPLIKHDVNTLWLVPTIISIILEFDRKNDGAEYSKKCIKLSLVGTAPLSENVKNAFEQKYGVDLLQNYGLSETLFISAQKQTSKNSKGVGEILNGVEVYIHKNSDKNLENTEEGEIFVKTPYLMVDYFNQKNELSTEGFFKTGDLGYIRENQLIITGREKDLIIRSGLNISPLTIENLLLKNPTVTKCAVIGIPHKINGEDIVAVLSLVEGTQLKDIKNELVSLCQKELSSTKMPTIYFQIDSFPMSSSGKIQKNILKELISTRMSKADYSPIKNNNGKIKTSIGIKIKKKISRPSKRLVEQMKRFPTTVVSDALNRLGAVSSKIQSISKDKPFCGPAITVEEAEGSNLMNHMALDLIHEGDVLAINGKSIKTRSCWGGLQTLRATKLKAAAVIIDGTVRDYDEIVAGGMPVYARGVSSGGPTKEPFGKINYPIAFGGVVICPGDLVMGDNDGIVVIPKELIEEIIPICSCKLEQEALWFKKVEEGKSTTEAVGMESFINKQSIDYE